MKKGETENMADGHKCATSNRHAPFFAEFGRLAAAIDAMEEASDESACVIS
jgi:hypothetical protein